MPQSEKPLKIAYLLETFPLLSETFVLHEILELKKQGLDIAIFSLFKPTENVIHEEARELAKETRYLASFRPLRELLKKVCLYLYAHFYFIVHNPLKYVNTFWFIYKVGKRKVFLRFGAAPYCAFMFRHLKVDHIHAHFAHIASEYAMLASMLSGIPYSFTIHAYDIFQKFRLIEEKIQNAKFAIAISDYNKKFIKGRCPSVNENKIYVVHCGATIQNTATSRAHEENRRGNFLILSVGRLVEKKGFKYLLDACNSLAEKNISNFLCKIVGHGPLKRELEELSQNLGSGEKIQFLGPLPSDKVFSLLQEADLAALPCTVGNDGDMDGIPVYLMEAMALEKPVISTHISGIPELVKDGAGILVPPRDSEALAEAIERIYHMDLNARLKMGQKGRGIVEKEFNIEKESMKIKDLFVSSLLETNNRHL